MYSLYDYRSTSTINGETNIQKSCHIIRKLAKPVNNLLETDLSLNSEEKKERIACIGKIKNTYWIFPPSEVIKSLENSLWLNLKYYFNEEGINGIQLKQDNIIKLGRCAFVVQEIVVTDATSDPRDININLKPNSEEKVFNGKFFNCFIFRTRKCGIGKTTRKKLQNMLGKR